MSLADSASIGTGDSVRSRRGSQYFSSVESSRSLVWLQYGAVALCLIRSYQSADIYVCGDLPIRLRLQVSLGALGLIAALQNQL